MRGEPSGAAPGYGVQEAARLLGLDAARIRAWVRAGLVAPVRGPRGALRFSFRDLAFLRSLRDLVASRIPPRRVHRALERLRAEVPAEELASVGLSSVGGEVVVREGRLLRSPLSGQYCFDFEGPERPRVLSFERAGREGGGPAEEWYRVGTELYDADRDRALDALRRAARLDPSRADVRIDLGCLLHELGALEAAESEYRAALALRPEDATARFDLAVVLEDRGRDGEARTAYEAALAADPECAEAHYNLARLCERSRDRAGALRHLRAYRRLSQPR